MPGLLAERLDRLDRAVDVRPRFGMDGDDVAPASANGSIQRSTGATIRWTSNGLAVCGRSAATDARADRQVGHEMPSITSTWIQSAPRCVDRAHFLAEPGKVGRKDRGRDQQLGHWPASRPYACAKSPNKRPAAPFFHTARLLGPPDGTF
jgi:hypothetical protein